MQPDFWNEKFAGTEYVYGKAPNAFLQETLPTIKGKTFLFPGEGEGRNAVWAARQNWEVTAFDQSTAGQQKCQQLANEFNVNVDYQINNVLDFSSTIEYDAVGLFYLHLPVDIRRSFHNKIWDLVSIGGYLILEGFNPNQLQYTSGGPKDISMLFSIEELKIDFPLATFIIAEEIESDLNEGPFHQGTAALTRIFAQKK
jgi:2-polyprenyl-3-methyl-5-hydroxy-6-metoxy-1,4-benzoquinol methylase